MNKTEYFDICIIGSGPASAFFVKEISKNYEKIAVVESGNNFINTDLSNIIDLESSNISGDINLGMSNQIGGSSNLWGGGLVKLNKIDLSTRPSFNFEGWPIEFDELLEYYKRVDNYLDLKGTSDVKYNSSNLELREFEMMHSPFKTQTLIDNNINLLENLEAQKLNCNETNSKVISLTCYDNKTNSIKFLKAKNYVLAAGGINNNRILLHSFNEIKANLKFDYHNIGKGISTHPKSEIGEIILYQNDKKSYDFYNSKKYESSYLKYQIGLIENTLKKYKVLNHCIRLDMPSRSILIKIIEKISSLIFKTKLGFLKKILMSKPIISFGKILYKFSEILDFSFKKTQILKVRCFFDQERRNSNQISLSSKLSNSGLPLAKINWQFAEHDWENVDLFLSLVKKELEELRIGEFQYKVPSNYIGIHSHFMGGTIIGKSSKNSVVNENLKVHGIKNLYISGPSVFPSFSYSNPFYTIAALSIRLADYFKSKI